MKLIHKLVIGYLVISSFSALSAYIAIRSLQSVERTFDNLTKDVMPEIGLLKDMESATLRIVSSTYEIISLKTEKPADVEAQIKDEENEIRDATERYWHSLAAYDEMARRKPDYSSSSEARFISSLRTAGKDLIETSAVLIVAEKGGARGTTMAERRTASEKAQENSTAAVEAALSHELHHLSEANDVRASIAAATKNTLLVDGVTLALGLLIGSLTAWSIARRVKRLHAGTVRVSEGNFDVNVTDSSSDELGTLANSFNLMTAELAQTNGSLRKEIEDREQVEEALRASEESYRDLFENAQDAIYVHDLDGKYLSANRAAEKLAGFSRGDILGKNFADFMAPESVQLIRANLKKKLEGKGPTTYEIEVQANDGRRVPVELSSRLIYEKGIPVAVQGMARDITERRRSEAQRQVIAEIVQGVITTANLDDLFKLAHHEIAKVLPAENCFIALHDQATNLLNYEYWVDAFDPVPAPHPIDTGLSSYMLRTGQPLMLIDGINSEMYQKGKVELSGTDSPSWLGVPLRTRTRTIGVLVVQSYDKELAYSPSDLEFMTVVGNQLGLAIQRKQIELELKTNEMQLTAAQQIAHIGSWEWDAIQKKLCWSAELFHIFGLPAREAGPTVEEFFAQVHSADVGLVAGAIKHALGSGTIPGFDFRIMRPDKTIRVLQVTGEVIADETGRVIRMWGTTQDITGRQRADKEREVISEVIQSVNLTSNLDELLHQVHRSLKGILYAENCCVVLYNKQTGLFEAPLFVDSIEANPFPIAPKKNCTAKVFRSGEPLLMNKSIYEGLLASGEVELIGRPAPSFLAVPLMTPAETIGVIVVQHYEDENVYSQRDVQFLSAVATQLALALERQRANDAVIESERRFRDLFYDAPVGYHELDIEGRITCVNTTELLMLGYSSEEMIGHHVWDFIEDSELARATFAEKLAGKKPLRNIERTFRCKDGTLLPVQLDDQMLNDPNGQLIGIRATMQDIRERKRTEEALRESEERFRDLFENASDVIYTADPSGNFTSLNKSGERMMGYTHEEALTLNFSQVVAPEGIELARQMIEFKQSTSASTVYELEMVQKNGEPLSVEVSSRAIFKNGKAIGIQGIGRDISQRKQVEAELKLARDMALESVRLKSEFLANMSHEIRTPMNGVIGMTGLLLETELSPAQREYTQMINASAESLMTVINDILDFSKIEAGKLRFEKLDFDLLAAVESPVALLAERAQAKSIEIASLIESDVPLALRGDSGRLRQIITNLIGNAVKFTEVGDVLLRVAKVSESDTHAILRFTIADTGVGISPEAQRRLFQAFVQADGSTTRRYGGTGLGLAISKQLVELMGGEIGVMSQAGAGSTFWFTARFEKQLVAHLLVTPTRLQMEGVRVLIVDDNETNRRVLQHQIASRGMQSTCAESGAAALMALRSEAGAGRSYGLAILDMQMPDMDGVMLAKEIKNDPAISSTRLLMLTSIGQQESCEALRRAGIELCLSKPVKQSLLFEALALILASEIDADPLGVSAPRDDAQQVAKPSAPMTDEGSAQQIRILVADDNPVNQKVALNQLQNLGYAADIVKNGREALAALARVPYPIVLMDCQMPELDGYEATAEIRRREEGLSHGTIVIAMTAHALAGEREKCLAAGMDDYLSKPVKLDVLCRMLEQWLKPTAGALHCEPTDQPQSGIETAKLEAVDLSVLAGLREIQQPGKPDLVTELIDLFMADSAIQLRILRQAVAQGDTKEVRRLAHLLKGSSANIGAGPLADLYESFEKTEMKNGDGVALMAKLDQEVEGVNRALQAERRPAGEQSQ
ncbi:MAG: two-component system, sensor histidine kinase and response regulator [Blastocatellia bacterium]|jgi:PAS domain S-box-containing protein|nr:two-component system, sensor histidine kinase and response regulator [Blastocatellia bacterium]